jgi:hypothetical protein
MSTAFDTRPSATTYELEDLVRDVWAGKIRVPHFQRDFRWGRRDVLRLFDSIVRGYPIGSLLLWVRDAPAQTIQLGALTIDAPKTDRARYVVDGQQRITSLANAMSESGRSDGRFSIAYHLRDKEFVARPPQDDPWVLPLPVIADLQKLLKWFNDHPEVADHLDQASSVTKTLRQYQVPAYNVTESDATVLQDVFDRMNNYGKRLSRAEIFSALFAEPEEQKAAQTLTIALIAEHLDKELGFGRIDDDTVLKAILARRGPNVMRDIRTEFDNEVRAGPAEFPGEQRDTAYAAGEDALRRAVLFLQLHAGVPHLTFLPYRHLLVVLARLFGHYPDVDVRNTQLLRRWFWRAAVIGNQGFKGSSTGATQILCARIRPNDLVSSIQGLLDALHSELPMPDLGRFRTNTAEGKIIMCGWWSRSPRSPYTGEPYERSHLTESLAGYNTAAEAVGYIVDHRSLPERQRRMASNRILIPSTVDEPVSEIDELLARQPVELGDESWKLTLQSHGVSDEAVQLLRRGEIDAFLATRQTILEENLRIFLAKVCERDFEDTPSLNDLVVDDLADAT